MKKYLLAGRETKQRGSKLRLKRRSKRCAFVFVEVIVLDRQEWWRKGHRPFGLAVIMALVNIRWPIGPWLHMTNVQVTFSLILLLRLSKWETKKNNRTKEKINTDSPSHLMLHSRGQSIDADFLQPSQQLVQGLSKGGQGLPDVQMSLSPIKRSTIHTSRTLGNTCSREKHFNLTSISRQLTRHRRPEASPSSCSRSPFSAAWTWVWLQISHVVYVVRLHLYRLLAAST